MKKFIHTPQDLPGVLNESYRHGKRFYQTPDGTFPSVTTVVGHEKQAFFANWRAQNPEEAVRTTTRGTELHSMVESYLLNEIDDLTPSPENTSTEKLFLQLVPELDKIDNIRALEAPLWSKTLKLAGRTDCIAEYNGKLSIIDFKGSTKPKLEKYIDNYLAQTCAYAIMFQERTGIIVDNYAILIACENGKNQVFEGRPISYVRYLKKMIDSYNAANAHVK